MSESSLHSKQSRFIRLAACLAIVCLLPACERPASMQVREGDDPHYEDEDVAFRTTYYFRVFDYCAGADSSEAAYTQVPRIDSLYRFRMTGKASTIGEKIKFESGTLKSYQIDPFGADVIYDKNTGKFRFVSQQESDQRAKREAALDDFERLLKRYKELTREADTDRQEAVNAAIKAAVAGITEAEGVADSQERTRILAEVLEKAVSRGAELSQGVPTSTLELLQSALNDQLQTFVEINPNTQALGQSSVTGSERQTLERRLHALRDASEVLQAKAKSQVRIAEDAINSANTARVQAAEDELAKEAAEEQLRLALEQKANANALVTLANEKNEEANALERRLYGAAMDQVAGDAVLVCPGSLTRRRGFQILGPEGWRTFDQDDRLVMAMTSDASPIIGVLEDLSSRVLSARSKNEVLLVPLVQERLRTVQAQRALEQLPPGTSHEKVVETVLKAFNQGDTGPEQLE